MGSPKLSKNLEKISVTPIREREEILNLMCEFLDGEIEWEHRCSDVPLQTVQR